MPMNVDHVLSQTLHLAFHRQNLPSEEVAEDVSLPGFSSSTLPFNCYAVLAIIS